jgi:hypothetical protein
LRFLLIQPGPDVATIGVRFRPAGVHSPAAARAVVRAALEQRGHGDGRDGR